MKKSILSFSLFLVLVSTAISQVTVIGVKLPEKLGKDKKLLTLNGAGVRNRFFMNVYVAAIYLQSKTSNPNEIINANEPMAVRLQIVSALITQDKMVESIREGFEKSTGGKTAPLKADIDKIAKVFNSSPIKVGDVFDIWYIPGEGVSASKNNKKMDFNIKGLAFKKAVFGIWLGPDPVDDPLKDKMLGL